MSWTRALMNNSNDQNSNSSSFSERHNLKTREDRIEFALKQAGTNELQAAHSLKFSQSSLNQYKKCRTQRFQRLAELASFLGVNAVWLHTGEGSPFVGSDKDPLLSQYFSISMNRSFYDNHYNKKYPGKNYEDLTIQLTAHDFQKLNSSSLSYILMPDDSMDSEIGNGSIVIIDESDIYIENGKLYAVVVYDLVTIRRTYQINKNVSLRVNNPIYQDQTFDRDLINSAGLDILGKVRLVKNYYA